MTATAKDILTAFDALDPQEKQEITVEILRRSAGADGVPTETYDVLAAELFRAYDAEEAGGANH